MNSNSTKLSTTPIGRAVAQSGLHPRSANQLIEYATKRAGDLLSCQDEKGGEKRLHYALLHAAFSSDEYSISGGVKNLPYQLGNLVPNSLADESEPCLIERPWIRNPGAANAAMVVMRWTEGHPRSQLAPEFRPVGSGVLQLMIQEGANILSSWCDCLIVCTDPRLADGDRPDILRDNPDILSSLRNLASVIRVYIILLRKGVPGNILWMTELMKGDTDYPLLSRDEIMALFQHNIREPQDFWKHDRSQLIIDALKSVRISDLNELLKDIRHAIRQYRQRKRKQLWHSSAEYVPVKLKPLIREIESARDREFETKIEELLDSSDIAYKRLDDGKIPGAADLYLGRDHAIQAVVELKTAKGEGTVSQNEAADVKIGASIVGLDDLPKVTLANPGFDLNVPWRVRNIRDLSLIEACHFTHGIALLISGEINENTF